MKKIALLLISLVSVLLFTANVSANPASAPRSVTKEEIAERFLEYPFDINAPVVFSVQPSVTLPLSAGVVSDESMQNALNFLNFVRFIAGMPLASYDAERVLQAQSAAVLHAYIGEGLTHYPERPDGVDETFFQNAYRGAAASNLSAGRATLCGSIIGWLNSQAGHRQWVLRPTTTDIGLGIASASGTRFGSYSAMHVTGNAFASNPFDYVAWPPALTPHHIYALSSRFSIGFFGYDRIDVNVVSVNIKRENTGETWVVSGDALTYVGGNHNSISFAPPAEFNAGDTLTVTVSGLRKNSAAVDFSYTTAFFDLLAMVRPPGAPNIETAADWAQQGINEAFDKGFIPEVIQDNYTQYLTRAEFCQLAVMWLEYKTGKDIDSILSERRRARNQHAFTDTDDPYILAAHALGIISGAGNNRFDPDGLFTREQAAMAILITCGVAGINLSDSAPAGFSDMHMAESWMVDIINMVYNAGIMGGTSDNYFSPKSTFTRQEGILAFNNVN